MPDIHGLWIRRPLGDAAVIFVHGLLSSGDACWRNGDVYWPELLTQEPLPGLGIYVFSYRTDALSGGYGLGDAVEALNAYLGLDGLFQLRQLIFVCHSMGGVVVRQFLVTRQASLIQNATRVGLFLVASPSLGSDYANWLDVLAKVLGHSQVQALRFSDSNAWLNDLDRNFINLKEGKHLALHGQEIVEDESFVLPGFVTKQVVRPFSGAKYFGDSVKIPGSNHFTIAKPSSRAALQHRLLTKFIAGFLESSNEAPASQSPSQSQAEASFAQQRLHRLKGALTKLEGTHRHVPPQHYYFYISVDKISKLETDHYIEAAERHAEHHAHAPTIGTTSRMTAEFRARCESVSRVLARLVESETAIDLGERRPADEFRGWAKAEISLSLTRREGTILILDGVLGDLAVTLACSAQGFVDYDPVLKELSVNSTNHWFFSSNKAYIFQTHFLVLSFDPHRSLLAGSPLYLALPSGILAP